MPFLCHLPFSLVSTIEATKFRREFFLRGVECNILKNN
jgi:hypothetical protein